MTVGSEFTVLFVSQPLQASTADQKYCEMSGSGATVSFILKYGELLLTLQTKQKDK